MTPQKPLVKLQETAEWICRLHDQCRCPTGVPHRCPNLQRVAYDPNDERYKIAR